MRHSHHDDQPAADSEDQVLSLDLVGEIMTQGPKLYDPEILTDAVRSAIAQIWELMPADKLVENRLGDIAYTLDEILTDAEGYTNDQRYAIATELVRYIRLIREQPAPAAPTTAQAVPAAPEPPAPAADDDAANAAAMAELLRMAEDDLRIVGRNSKTIQRLCKLAVIQGNNGRVDEVICLQGARVTGNNGRVILYVPFGVTVHEEGNNGEVVTHRRTPVQLLAMARTFDL